MPTNLTPIFDLGDRGVIQLTGEIGRLRATLATLQAVDLPESEHPLNVADRLVQQTIEAAENDSLDGVDYSAPIAAAHAAAVAQQQRETVVNATAEVEAGLTAAVLRAAVGIVTALQPTFDKAVLQLREALQVTAQWPDPARALSAPAKVRSLLAARHTVRHEIGAMLAARDLLRVMGYRSSVDVDGEFGLCRNFNELWPRQARQINPQGPWGDAPDRFEWFLTHGGDVWLPTLSEQDAQFEKVYGDAIRETAQRAAQQRALADAIGGGTRTYTPQTTPRPAPAESTADLVRTRLFGSAGSNDNEITIEATPTGLVVTP